jgi:hypothetical protein
LCRILKTNSEKQNTGRKIRHFLSYLPVLGYYLPVLGFFLAHQVLEIIRVMHSKCLNSLHPKTFGGNIGGNSESVLNLFKVLILTHFWKFEE